MGIVNPVYMASARLKSEAGASASGKERESAAMHRKYIDIVSVQVNANNKNTKKWPGVLRKFVMKYKVKLNARAVRTLFGKSQIMEALFG